MTEHKIVQEAAGEFFVVGIAIEKSSYISRLRKVTCSLVTAQQRASIKRKDMQQDMTAVNLISHNCLAAELERFVL